MRRLSDNRPKPRAGPRDTRPTFLSSSFWKRHCRSFWWQNLHTSCPGSILHWPPVSAAAGRIRATAHLGPSHATRSAYCSRFLPWLSRRRGSGCWWWTAHTVSALGERVSSKCQGSEPLTSGEPFSDTQMEVVITTAGTYRDIVVHSSGGRWDHDDKEVMRAIREILLIKIRPSTGPPHQLVQAQSLRAEIVSTARLLSQGTHRSR